MGGLELGGDWDKFIKMKDINVAKKLEVVTEQCGEIIRGDIIKAIRDQKIQGPPLKKETREAKSKPRYRTSIRKDGTKVKRRVPSGSDKRLIDQGDYMSSFVSEKIRYDKVRIGTNHPQARALEKGYAPRNLPARPHVDPAVRISKMKVALQYLRELKRILGVK
jgi:hypothetical protein